MRYVVVAILVVHVGLLVSCAARYGPVQSEDAHLAAGAAHLLLGRFDLYRVNPPLVRTIGALPVVVCQPSAQRGQRNVNPRDRREYQAGVDFLYRNRMQAAWLVRIARWTCIVFSLWGACVCYLWAQKLFGKCAGLLALVVWCFSPNILGHASTIMPDVPAAALGAGAVYCFWLWLRRPQWLEAMVAGVTLGLAELCKFTLLILYPLLPALWVVYRLSEWKAGAIVRQDRLRQPTMLAVAMLASVCVVNCGYLFEDTFTPLQEFRFQATLLTGYKSLKETPPEGGNRFAGTWLGRLPVPLPANFVQGIDTQRYDFERGLPSYLRGEWADCGWWHYYLYSLLIKTPLGTWLLLAAAVGMSLGDARGFRKEKSGGRRQGRGGTRPCRAPQDGLQSDPPSAPVSVAQAGEGRERRSRLSKSDLSPSEGQGCSIAWRDEMVALVPALAILIFVSSQTGFSVHSRYAIPALPFFFVWMGKAGRAFAGVTRRSGAAALKDGALQGLKSGHEDGESRRGIAPWRACEGIPSARTSRALVAFALAWSVLSSLIVYPHSLSYFNELAAILPTPADATYPKPISDPNKEDAGAFSMIERAIAAGPRNGPRHLLDSNIDWGQDLFHLKDWLDRHREVQLDGLAVWGSYPAALAGITETPYPPSGPPEGEASKRRAGEQFGPKPGWYVLSVNYIYGRDRQYRYFLHFEPVAMAGYSIYIYHVTLDEANQVRRTLGLKELKRDGAEGQSQTKG